MSPLNLSDAKIMSPNRNISRVMGQQVSKKGFILQISLIMASPLGKSGEHERNIDVKMLRSYSKRPLPASSRPRQTTVELLFLARRPSCSSVLWICGRLHQTSTAVTRRRAVFAVYSCCVKLDYTANRGRRSGLCHQMRSWPQWDVSNARSHGAERAARRAGVFGPGPLRWGEVRFGVRDFYAIWIYIYTHTDIVVSRRPRTHTWNWLLRSEGELSSICMPV